MCVADLLSNYFSATLYSPRITIINFDVASVNIKKELLLKRLDTNSMNRKLYIDRRLVVKSVVKKTTSSGDSKATGVVASIAQS